MKVWGHLNKGTTEKGNIDAFGWSAIREMFGISSHHSALPYPRIHSNPQGVLTRASCAQGHVALLLDECKDKEASVACFQVEQSFAESI